MIQKALKILGFWFSLLIVLYAAFAFGKWSFNPGEWGEERSLFSAFACVALMPVIGIILSYNEKD